MTIFACDDVDLRLRRCKSPRAAFGIAPFDDSRHHALHRDIMHVGGHRIEQLERKTDAYATSIRKSRQQAIVVAFASSQTMSASVESHAWDHGELYLIIQPEGKQLSRRLLDAKGTFPQRSLPFVEAKLKLVAHDYRKQHSCTPLVGLASQGTDIYFVGQRAIKQESACLLPPGRSKHSQTYIFRHRCQLSSGVKFLLRTD